VAAPNTSVTERDLSGPLALEPCPIVHPWAGRLARRLPSCQDLPQNVGEILLAAEECLVRTESLAGVKFGDLVAAAPDALVGLGWPRNRGLPVIARVLDVGRDLPLWVHPYAASMGCRKPNTRFWYCIAAEPEARLAAGLRVRVTRRQFLERLDSPQWESLLQVFPARPGDAFLVPSGRLHRIGGGVLLVEVQQRRTPPYVLGEEDAEHPRFPVEEAISAIRFEDRHLSRISRDAAQRPYTRRIPLTPHCPAFNIEEVRLAPDLRDRTTGRTFHLIVALHGEVQITGPGGMCQLQPVEAAWIPAAGKDYALEAVSGRADVLRVTLP